MKKLKISDLKKVTKVAAPVERTVEWSVDVTEENLDFLRKLTENKQLNIGDVAELEGGVYIKRLTFEEQQEVAKAYRWDKDQADEIKLKDINMNQMFAAQLMGSVCEDKKGTPFFASLARFAACSTSPAQPMATQVSPFARSLMYWDEWK